MVRLSMDNKRFRSSNINPKPLITLKGNIPQETVKWLKIALIAFFLLILSCQPSPAEPSLALKKGYVVYDKGRDSKYPGGNILDSEFSNGMYVGWDFLAYFLRLDVDFLETGNEFSKPIGIAYEKVDMTFKPVILSIGTRFWNFYGALGIGYSFNEATIEEYLPYPIDCDMKDSLAFTTTLGYEQPMGKWFSFGEFRYLRSESDVIINGSKAFTEDISNKAFYLGVGYKW